MINIASRDKILAKLRERASKPGVDLEFRSGSESPRVRRIPTGSPMLDYATGGGVPLGRWTRLWGGKSSGKTLTGWNIAREAQNMGLSVVYYNIEKQFEPEFTARCGVDIDELEIVNGTTIEDIGEALESLLDVYHVHILDSCSEGVALSELKADYGDSLMAAKARAWGQVFYKVQRHFDEEDNAIIYMDQVRESFGRGDNNVHAPGGKLMEHRSSLTLYFKRGQWLFKDKHGRLVDKDTAGPGRSMSGRTEADGIEVDVWCEKNRVSRPFRHALMRYEFDGAKIDIPWELAQAASYLDAEGRPAHLSGNEVIFPRTTPNSSYYKMPDGSTMHGVNQLTEALAKDDELKKIVLDSIRQGL